jgi:plasmid maintenance system antidote protein VapI
MLNPIRVREALTENFIQHKALAVGLGVPASRISEYLRENDPVPIPQKYEAKIKEITGETLKWLRTI